MVEIVIQSVSSTFVLRSICQLVVHAVHLSLLFICGLSFSADFFLVALEQMATLEIC